MFINEKPLSTEQRDALDDKEFGIPELRAYPLNDKSHVEQAVRMFNHVDPEYEKELADNLNKAIKKFGLPIEVGDTNRFKKYVKESRAMSRMDSVGAILEGLSSVEERIDPNYKEQYKQAKKNVKKSKNGTIGQRHDARVEYERLKKDASNYSKKERDYVVNYHVQYYEWDTEKYGKYTKEAAEEKYSYHNWKIVKTEDKTKIVKGHSVAEVSDKVREEFKKLNPSGTKPEKYADYGFSKVTLKD